MTAEAKSKLNKVLWTAYEIFAFLIVIALTGFLVNWLWYLFCAIILGWRDSAPDWYIEIQQWIMFGIFLVSAIMWWAGAYWLRLKKRNGPQMREKA